MYLQTWWCVARALERHPCAWPAPTRWSRVELLVLCTSSLCSCAWCSRRWLTSCSLRSPQLARGWHDLVSALQPPSEAVPDFCETVLKGPVSEWVQWPRSFLVGMRLFGRVWCPRLLVRGVLMMPWFWCWMGWKRSGPLVVALQLEEPCDVANPCPALVAVFAESLENASIARRLGSPRRRKIPEPLERQKQRKESKHATCITL